MHHVRLEQIAPMPMLGHLLNQRALRWYEQLTVLQLQRFGLLKLDYVNLLHASDQALLLHHAVAIDFAR